MLKVFLLCGEKENVEVEVIWIGMENKKKSLSQICLIF